ncbi:MAG: hypothetical protein JNK05_30375 [Myxococcales bacterium]|nr:hypothetical protein [Myxococcales bacterium]
MAAKKRWISSANGRSVTVGSPSIGSRARGAIDDATLAAIRGWLARASRRSGTIDFCAVAALANALPAGLGLTVDHRASSAVGAPVVLLWPAEPQAFATLTRREREIASLVAAGLRNREIARRLFIAEGTVKDHVHNILAKTGFASRAQLAASAATMASAPSAPPSIER